MLTFIGDQFEHINSGNRLQEMIKISDSIHSHIGSNDVSLRAQGSEGADIFGLAKHVMSTTDDIECFLQNATNVH